MNASMTGRGADPGRRTRATVVGVGALVFDPRGNLLIGHRIKRGEASSWCLAGGHLEPGETFEQAATREVREESGVHATDARVLAVAFHLRSANTTRLIAGIAAHANDTTTRTPKPDTFDAGTWVPLDDLPTRGMTQAKRSSVSGEACRQVLTGPAISSTQTTDRPASGSAAALKPS